MFVVTGVIERAGGSLYCAVLYVCPLRGVLGKRRKVMPTGSERLIWAQGSPSTLRAVTTVIKGVKLTMASAICWENYMPLLRQSLYSQNVNLYLAPTADARDTWLPLMRTVGIEGRAFVLSANQCLRTKNLPDWVHGRDAAATKKKQQQTTSATVNGHGLHQQRPSSGLSQHRRGSTTITEDKHEIIWPAPKDETSQSLRRTSVDQQLDRSRSPQFRRRSIITETAERHEICWPIRESDRQEAATEGSEDAAMTDASNANGKADAVASVDGQDDNDDDDFACAGGSSIVSPFGEVLAGPLWKVEDGGLLTVDVDFEDCDRGRLDLDVAGSYSRNDSFKLTVDGLDLSPPP